MKKGISITIDVAQLVYDILNETYLRSRVNDTGDNYKQVAATVATTDEENKARVMRSVKKAYSSIKTALSEYLDEYDTIADNQRIDDEQQLVLNLMMPDNYNEAATPGLGEAVHDYIKNMAVGEWYIATDKTQAEEYGTLAQASMSAIQVSVHRRKRPVKPD